MTNVNTRFNMKSGIDPQLQPSGMTEWNKRAFTLIELLVVILIIGLLAAVALPQYQLVVVKSKTAAMLPFLQTIAAAEDLYYLENGSYTYNRNDILTVGMPDDCQRTSDNGNSWTCGSNFLVDFGGAYQGVYLFYCPGNNTKAYATCSSQCDFSITQYFKHIQSPNAGKRICNAKTELGSRICNWLN